MVRSIINNMNLTDLLLSIIAFFAFLDWYKNSEYVNNIKMVYAKTKHKLIRYIKKIK